MTKTSKIKPYEVCLASIGSVDESNEAQQKFAMECTCAMERSLTEFEYFGYSFLLPERLIRVMQSIECALLMTGAEPNVDYTRLDLIKLAIEAEKVWSHPMSPDVKNRSLTH